MHDETFAPAVDVGYGCGNPNVNHDRLAYPNAGTAPSSDRTAPGRMSRSSAPDRTSCLSPDSLRILMPLKPTSSSYRVPVEEVPEALDQRTGSGLRSARDLEG